VRKSAYEIGLVVEGQAKLLAPKDSGYLAASITTQAGDGTGTEPGNPAQYGSGRSSSGGFSGGEMMIQAPTNPDEVYVGTPLPYGPSQEFGTVRAFAQPFLRPALALAQGKSLTIVRVQAKYYFKEYLT